MSLEVESPLNAGMDVMMNCQPLTVASDSYRDKENHPLGSKHA